MVKSLFCLHIMEGESHVLNHYLSELHKQFKGGKGIYQILNIVVFSEENPDRCFSDWKSDNSYQGTPINLEYEKEENAISDRTWEIYAMICDAGRKQSNK